MQLPNRILIVEDEEILAENMRDFLVRRQAQVRVSSSAEAAVDEVLSFQPEYVVLDYSLPGMNGLDAFSNLRQYRTPMRGLLITGHPTDRLRAVANDLGIEHVLTKPFSFSELEQALRAPRPDADPGGPDPERRNTLPRRQTERRSAQAATDFPLMTASGLVLRDRRRADRRAASGRRFPDLTSFCIAAA